MRIPRSRAGLSLAELAVVIALLGLVGAVIGSAILHQQRFYGDASDVLDMRQGVRDALEVLSTDIRGSTSEDTVRLMTDSAVELFANVGISVACRTVSAAAVALAEESVGGNALTSLLLHPDTGDLAMLLIEDSTEASGRRWERHRIAAFARRSSGTACLRDGVAPVEGFLLTLQSAPSRLVPKGMPVRFVRRGRYSLYRSSDDQWYLGYRRCNPLGPSVCGAIQPVSGPYRRYSADRGKTGILFEYFDERGERITGAGSPLSVARVDVTAQAEGRQRRRFGGAVRLIAELAVTSVAIRNR